jgi:hypothetical protein
LVGGLILPVCEVADVSGFSKRDGPIFGAMKYSIIRANGKEDFSSLSLLPSQCKFYFVAYPSTDN